MPPPHADASPGERVRPDDLPEFSNPPLVEVVLGVQFAPIDKLTGPYLGLFWARYRDRFPKLEVRPPLDHIVEEFGGPSLAPPRVEFTILHSLPSPRAWFAETAGNQLIQVQNDRFLHNWRKATAGATYPRYETIRSSFEHELNDFRNFLSDEDCGELTPDQCEVTYVNHIEIPRQDDAHSVLSRVLSFWRPSADADTRIKFEQVDLTARHVLLGEKGDPLGRLHVSIRPGQRRSDSAPLIILELTARGRPIEDSTFGVLRFFDVGREQIVRTFADITSQEMHRLWGRHR